MKYRDRKWNIKTRGNADESSVFPISRRFLAWKKNWSPRAPGVHFLPRRSPNTLCMKIRIIRVTKFDDRSCKQRVPPLCSTMKCNLLWMRNCARCTLLQRPVVKHCVSIRGDPLIFNPFRDCELNRTIDLLSLALSANLTMRDTRQENAKSKKSGLHDSQDAGYAEEILTNPQSIIFLTFDSDWPIRASCVLCRVALGRRTRIARLDTTWYISDYLSSQVSITWSIHRLGKPRSRVQATSQEYYDFLLFHWLKQGARCVST